ncbi:MAG: hypothetical protein ACLF0G_01875 [Candidatus Brocadiia bacterium]
MRPFPFLLSLIPALVVCGCGGGGEGPSLAQEGVDRVLVTTQTGSGAGAEVTITEPEAVEKILQTIADSELAPDAYEVAKTKTMELFSGTESVAKLSIGGDLFETGEKQYRDPSGFLNRVVECVLLARAPLLGTISPPETVSIGQTIDLVYTVQNVGPEPVELAGEFTARGAWAKKIEAAEGEGTDWTRGVEEDQVPDTDLRIEVQAGGQQTLQPGDSRTYTFPIPTDNFLPGTIMIRIASTESLQLDPDGPVKLPPPPPPFTVEAR